MSPVIFAIHVGRLALMIVLVAVFLLYDKVVAAWAALLTVSLSTLLVQVWLLQEPALIGFALFSLVGPAIVMPLRINITLIGIMIVVLFLGARSGAGHPGQRYPGARRCRTLEQPAHAAPGARPPAGIQRRPGPWGQYIYPIDR